MKSLGAKASFLGKPLCMKSLTLHHPPKNTCIRKSQKNDKSHVKHEKININDITDDLCEDNKQFKTQTSKHTLLDKQEITLHISFKYQLPTVIIQSKYSTTIFNKNIDNIHIYSRKKNHNLALKGQYIIILI